MDNVISIHSRRKFSQEQAEDLLPIVRHITEQSANTAKDLQDQLKFVPPNEPLYKRLRLDLDLIVRRWAVKISKLGCEPRGLWFVDFDSGDGWFSWRYGDEALSFFHPHGDTKTDGDDLWRR